MRSALFHWPLRTLASSSLAACSASRLVRYFTVAPVASLTAGYYSGPCDACGLDLYGRLGAAIVRCRGCEGSTTWRNGASGCWPLPRTLWRIAALITRALSRLGTSIQVNRLYTWANRRIIVAHGTDAQGRPLYRIGDILDLLAKMDASKKEKAIA
jgi:hypothetical protein